MIVKKACNAIIVWHVIDGSYPLYLGTCLIMLFINICYVWPRKHNSSHSKCDQTLIWVCLVFKPSTNVIKHFLRLNHQKVAFKWLKLAFKMWKRSHLKHQKEAFGPGLDLLIWKHFFQNFLRVALKSAVHWIHDNILC